MPKLIEVNYKKKGSENARKISQERTKTPEVHRHDSDNKLHLKYIFMSEFWKHLYW